MKPGNSRRAISPAVLARLSPERQQLLKQRLQNSGAKIVPRSGQEAPPLSFAQQQLWFLDRLYPDATIYNVTRAFRLTGMLQEEILQQAFGTLVQRHETLRTSFSIAHGQAVQIITPEMELPVPVIDLVAGTEQQIDEQIFQHIKKAEQTPIDLGRGPLIRVKLLRIDPDQHVLVLVIHHVITDGLSLNLMIQELATLYAAYSNGQASPLAPLPVQYADYAAWQHQQMQAGKLDKQIAYWRSKLENASMLELPGARSYPLEQDFRGAKRTLKLPSGLGEKLKTLSQTAGVSLFMTFLGAFQALLHRYRGQEDIVIATPIAGRTRPELDGLLGYFVNTLVLRTNLGGNPTFIELLGRARETALGAFAHQDLPFAKLVEKLQVERHAARNPFFNVMINFREGLDQWTDFADIGVRQEEPRITICTFPLKLYISPSRKGFELRMDYQTALFDAERVDAILRQYSHFLQQLVADPGKPILSYSLIDAEFRKLLPDPTRVLEEPAQQAVTVMFADCAAQHPEREAVSQGERHWTYAELDRASDQLAQLLLQLGIVRGDAVAITGERSFGQIVAILGILKSGGVMLPVDSGLPAKRRATMLRIAKARQQVVIVSGRDEGQAVVRDIPVLKLQANTGLAIVGTTIHSDEWVDLTAPQPDDPAYIFFTSGTTGTPKGILGSHKGLGHFISWQRKQFTNGTYDRVAHLGSLSFDGGLRNIFLPLSTAGVLCLPLTEEESDVLPWLQRQAITFTHVVPTVAQSWLFNAPDEVSLPAMRLLSFGGEALSDTVVREWRSRLPENCTIVNQYGPTETTLAKCFHVLDGPLLPGTQPIGRALPQAQALILKQDGTLAGIGEEGEIVLRSPFGTLGYLAASEDVTSGFKANPFRNDPQDIVYYSGDRGCYRPDGTLDFLGRRDDQVKIHGIRIELEEIRIILNSHPNVLDAVVLVREGYPGDKRLVAYVVLDQSDPPTTETLRRSLAEHLPNAMIPGVFIPLEVMPLSPNGKLDRKALPAPELDRSMLGSEYVLPRTSVEETLVELWQEVLALDAPPGIYDDFFALGGYSLLAVHLVARIEETLNQAMPLQHFFTHPSVFEVAEKLDPSGQASIQQKSGLKIEPRPEGKAPPLSFAQQRLWFLDRLHPEAYIYNTVRAFRLSGALHQEVLHQAFNTLVQRHEILRTSFASPHGQAVQIVALEMELDLPVIDLDTGTKQQIDEQIQQHIKIAAQIPFDLEQGPLIRVMLLRIDTGQHILVMVMHHIITDGLSRVLMMRELETLYVAYSSGQQPPLTPLPIQYADYAIWQHRKMQAGELDKQLVYWQTQLEDAPMLELPTDRPYPLEQTFLGARRSLKLPAGLGEKLKALSQTAGVSLFMTFLGAFQTLLHRYRGQEDIVIATPIAGRTRPEHEGLIGFFVNTLVLRTDLSGNPTFVELLGRVRDVALGAYAHQDIPFEKLVETLQPERHAARAPFFNVMINYREGQKERLHFADLDICKEDCSNATSKFPLELYISPSPEGIEIRLDYQTDIFDAGHIDCILRQYAYLLEKIAADPEQLILAYSLVDSKSRGLLPDPARALEEPTQQPVMAMFADCAAKFPEQVAVSQGERHWSYAELDQASGQLAQLLHQRGIARGDAVAVTGERSFGLISTMLGVLKSGGVMLPVDPSLPAKRRATMLRTAQASVQLVVGNDQGKRKTAGADIQVLELAADSGLPTIKTTIAEDAWIDLPAPQPGDPAYIFFTSGTTGSPKGILGSHKGLGHFISWQRKQFSVDSGDRVAQLANLSFDVVLRDIFLPLTSAGVLCLPLPEDELDVLRWLNHQAITVVHTVPSVAQSWLLDAPDEIKLPALRLLFFAGEALTDSVVRHWRSRLADSCSIVNLYGPTETTLVKCFHVVDEPLIPGTQPIGRALPQTQAMILKQDGALAGISEEGEIVLRSSFGTLGYLVASEDVTSGFKANPFRNDSQDIVYYTGDRGCYRADGTLDYLGRWDDQVKIHGVRIELEEIRIVLNSHPGVLDAVVLVREDHPGDKRLAAYIVPDQSNPPTTETLRRALALRLPNIMIPGVFVLLEAMPLTPNGKLERKALPAPELDRSMLGSEYVQPSTTLEETLADLWREVLTLDTPPGIHDDFFALGGHSLLAVHLLARIEETLNQVMPLQHFYVHPTIAEIVEKLETSRSSSVQREDKPGLKIVPRTGREAPPLSFAQQRLWFLDHLYPNASIYNIKLAFRLAGALQLQALRQALNALVKRHESLRTSFASSQGEAVQIITPEMELPLSVIDLDAGTGQQIDEQIKQHVQEAAETTFDLAQGPLIRVKLLRLNPEQHVLVLAIHHIITDGSSQGLLIRELETLYAAYCRGQASPLAPLPIQYADYAIWQHRKMQAGELDKQLVYWQTQLEDTPMLELPTDRPYPLKQTFLGARRSLQLPAELGEKLKALSQSAGVSLFMTFLGAFQALLHRYRGQEDIVIATPIAGRTRPELEGLIGFFVNTLVLRTDVSGNPTFTELLSRVREVALGAYANQDIPFEKLVEKLHPERDIGRTPFFNVMINFREGRGQWSNHFADLIMCREETGATTSKFPLALYISPSREGIQLSLNYQTDLFDADHIDCILRQYAYLLKQLAVDPGQPILSYSLVDNESRELLPDPAWTLEEPTQKPVTLMFAECTAQYPERVAVSQGERCWSYADLDQASDQLAQLLQRQGIAKGDVVSMSGRRSFGMVVAILGILKSGGVMLPIDPILPVKRRVSMLQIAQVRLQIMVDDPLDEKSMAGLDVPVLKLGGKTGLVTVNTTSEQDAWIKLPVPQADDPAYIFFTSGTTGRPKGILGSHKGLGHLISWQRKQFNIGMNDRVAQLTRLSFDLFLIDIFLPLSSAAALCLPLEKDESEIFLWLQRQAITALSAVPSVARFWLADVSAEASLPALRFLSFGGEALIDTVVKDWRARVPDSCTIVNIYGPTETTVSRCFYIVDEPVSPGIQPIGRALPQTQSLVLKKDGALAGVGETGEIVIRSPFNTLGYLADSGAADSGFKANPFRNDIQEMVYYTGDKGYYRADGNLIFLRRLDDQVKIHGVRMELEEIRGVLARHSEIKEAAILVHEDPAGDKRLVAYFIPEQTDPPSTQVLRRALAEHLPNAMIPGIFVPLDAMPLTPGGKLDRKALPVPELERSTLGSEYIAPGTPLEKSLADLWQEVLKLDVTPGIYDDFFALGGHSLLAVHLIVRIEEILKQAVPLQYFYTHPTIAEITRALDAPEQLSTRIPGKLGAKITRRSANEAPPLSFAQQRLWFLDRLHLNASLYNIKLVFRLTGELNVEALQRAFNTLVQRHETLRTSFAAPQGIAVQIIAPEMELALPVIDLNVGAGQQIDEQIKQHIQAAEETIFDLAQGPLIHVKLLRLDPGQHVLILVIHHIITDGLSLDPMMQELEALYTAYTNGQVSPLAPLTVQYADYAVWQHQQMQDGEFEEQLAYWQEQLEGASMLELPTHRPYLPEQNFQGARRSLQLPTALDEKLKALSQTAGVSLFMTFLGVFQTLLHRYHGQEDIVIATPIAGRTRPELQGLIGFFVNTLVLRTDLGGNPTFIKLLERVRKTALGAYAHQDIPFEKLVEKLQPERNIGQTPIFNVMINFREEHDPGNISFADLDMYRENTGTTTSKFPLALHIALSREGARLSLSFQTDIFDAGHIDCILRQYAYLLEQITADPNQPILSYSLIDAESRELLPDPARELDDPIQQPVTAMFAECAAEYPEREAVCQGEQCWTYAELDRSSDLIAQLLYRQGIARGDAVAVSGERSFGLIAAILGILKCGGVMLPIAPGLPTKRRDAMLQIAQVQLQILVDESVDGNISAAKDIPVLNLEANTGLARASSSAQKDAWVDLPAPHPDDPAYIIFTSGTTGQPKGILGSHKGLGHLTAWQRNRFDIGMDDRVAQLNHLSFDMFLGEVFLTLCSAAVLCLPLKKDESEVVLWAQRQAITTLKAVPSVAQSWLADAPVEALLPALRFLTFGGEALTDTVVKDWRARVPDGCTIVNFYGPTEASIAKCFYVVDESVLPGIQPIGRSLPQSQSLILNKDGALAGIGEMGEIVLRSPFNSLGYLAASDEVDSGFRENPFRNDVQETVYYTGDKGCYRPDGMLDFLGRLDDQVKIHGVRIELEEIRMVLARHPQVKEAAILVREDQAGDKRLVAYIISEQDDPPTTRSLRRALAEHLPNAMIPGIFVSLDTMPLTPSGKLDRKALPVPELDRSMPGSEYVSPRTSIEKSLVDLWQAVLKLDISPGIHDDFFALGGHSLLAVQLVTRMEERLKQVISLQHFYIHPTVAEVAEELDQSGRLSIQQQQQQQQPQQQKQDVKTVSQPERKAPPLSFAQQRLWFLDRLYPNISTYNIRLALRLSGTLDKEALQRAFNTLVKRHETLRTSFAAPHGIAVQIIAAEKELPLPVIDLDAAAGQKMDEQIKQHIQTTAETIFDLATGPLIQVKLLRLDPRQHVLILVIHHIITDGLSMDLMMQELEALYTAYSSGQTSPLAPLPIQYADYAVWQHQQMQGDELDKQLAYWRSQLKDAPMLELPIDRPYPREQNFQGARRSLKLSSGLGKKLKAISQTAGVSLFMTFLGAFQALLHRYRGQEDIVLATPIAGRTRPEHEGLLGFFVNTLAIRTDLSGNPTFIELLGRVRDVALSAYAHQDMPFEKLVESLQPERHVTRTPFFNVMINFRERRGERNARFADLNMRRESFATTGSKFPLEFYISPSPEGIQLSMAYQTDLFDAEHIDCMLRQYAYLLEQITVDPDQPILSYSLIDAESRERLPDPTREQEEPAQQPVTVMFADCVAQYPEREAVSQGEQRWTYAELDQASGRLAQLLHQRGITKGDAVALSGERSFGFVVAMLGILKIGGVMLPIDSSLPAQRRATMLVDAQASLQIIVANDQDDSKIADEDIPVLELTCNTGLPTVKTAIRKDAWIDLPVPELDDPAYIFFTSGTTGKPKGILGSHKGLGHFISWQREQFSIDQHDRVAQLTSPSFDVILQDVFVPLTSSGVLCLPVKEASSEVLSWLQRQAVTIVHTVPSAAQSWLSDAPDEVSLPSLRLLFFIGEALTEATVEKWRARIPDSCAIVNLYGTTETTIIRCFHVVDKPALPGIQPIGVTLPQTQALIVKQDGALAGIGEAGEIVLRSPFSTLGYLASAGESESGFQENPFRDDAQDRVYYTGDRGCYRPDGTLEFLGRWDDQVKIRGVRIELEEIRIVLNNHPKIKQAAVLVHEDPSREKRLVAYIVLEDSSLPSTESLRRALSEHLPNTMIPEIFMPVEAMPLTPSGKLNRKALPAPELDRSMLDSEYVAPRTEIEETLANLWQEVLMLDSPPGIQDDFFALGGHSLLSAHLVARMEETLGQAIPLQYFFAHPTIAELAEELDTGGKPSIDKGPQSELHAAGPWQLVPGLYDKLLSYVGSWRGERAAPNSLIIGHNTNGSRPPVFWVLQSQHELSQLAAYLDDDQPLYGMRSGSAIMSYEELNIQTLALGYVEEIVALRPTGPLLIGGNCQGARIALAIAQHLLRRQHEVCMLILMEWIYPPQPYGGPVTLLFGRDSHANPYTRFRYPELTWSRVFSDYQVEIISGAHSQFFDEPNIQSLVTTLEHQVTRALKKPPRLLPQAAKQVKLRVIDPPVSLQAGHRHLLQVEVQNVSTVTWGRGEDSGLMLGNEWSTPDGKMLSQLDGRVPMSPLMSGETGKLELPVMTPSQTGQINLDIKLIEEGVRRLGGEEGTIRLVLNLVDQT